MATTMPAWLRRAKGHAIDLLFPARCLSCGADLLPEMAEMGPPGVSPYEVNFCATCTGELEAGKGETGIRENGGRFQTARKVCHRCAARIPDLPGIECPHCNRKKLWFDRAVALGPYEGRLRRLVLRMKRDRTETIAKALGELVCRQLESFRWAGQFGESDPGEANLVLPVPMRLWKQVARGTNGPAVLAQVIGRHFGLSVESGVLGSSRNLSPQKGLSRQSRFQNVRGGMVLRAGYPLAAAKVLLVDDILTTGATCSEAARILKQAGAADVTVVVIARTAG